MDCELVGGVEIWGYNYVIFFIKKRKRKKRTVWSEWRVLCGHVLNFKDASLRPNLSWFN